MNSPIKTYQTSGIQDVGVDWEGNPLLPPDHLLFRIRRCSPEDDVLQFQLHIVPVVPMWKLSVGTSEQGDTREGLGMVGHRLRKSCCKAESHTHLPVSSGSEVTEGISLPQSSHSAVGLSDGL